jgi:hypothetical protein
MANYAQYGYTQSQYNTAFQVYSFFKNAGWTDNAIFGMLGNMTQESSLNSNEWQSGYHNNTNGGFGLVQWTPATKLINWCNSKRYDYTQTLPQCERILFELNSNDSQFSKVGFNISFKQYTQLNDSPGDMAKIFCSNYEKAGIPATGNRINYANQWCAILSGANPGGSGNGTTPVDSTVHTIQCYLNAMTKAGLAEDGIMGSATKAKIEQFERIVGISVDGIWGTQCQNATNQIYAKPLCGLAYTHPIPTRLIQFRIGISIDGIFGNNTANHVKSWQKANGLSADGIFGPLSWNKLLS